MRWPCLTATGRVAVVDGVLAVVMAHAMLENERRFGFGQRLRFA